MYFSCHELQWTCFLLMYSAIHHFSNFSQLNIHKSCNCWSWKFIQKYSWKELKLEIHQSVGGPKILLSTCINTISPRFVSQCNEMHSLLKDYQPFIIYNSNNNNKNPKTKSWHHLRRFHSTKEFFFQSRFNTSTEVFISSNVGCRDDFDCTLYKMAFMAWPETRPMLILYI